MIVADDVDVAIAIAGAGADAEEKATDSAEGPGTWGATGGEAPSAGTGSSEGEVVRAALVVEEE